MDPKVLGEKIQEQISTIIKFNPEVTFLEFRVGVFPYFKNAKDQVMFRQETMLIGTYLRPGTETEEFCNYVLTTDSPVPQAPVPEAVPEIVSLS